MKGKVQKTSAAQAKAEAIKRKQDLKAMPPFGTRHERFGTLGPASDVRHIDPNDYQEDR